MKLRLKMLGLAIAVCLLSAVPAKAAPGDTPKVVVKEFSVRLFPNAPAVTFRTVTLTWVDSTTKAICLPTNVPACTNFGYNVLAGPTSGSEVNPPLNSTLIAGTTFTDTTLPVQTTTISRFYVVQAQVTVGTTVNTSASSNEVSVTFPGLVPPTNLGVSSAQ